jgi:hypothetical protein
MNSWIWIISFVVVLLDGPMCRADEPSIPVKVERSTPGQYKLPLKVSQQPKLIEKVNLFVSRDNGKSWLLSTTVAASESFIPFEFTENGLYLFTCQMIKFDGSKLPASEKEFKPVLVVNVEGDKVTPSPVPPTINEEEFKEDLRKERVILWRQVEALQKRVEELERRLSALENLEKKPKAP